jgi:O-acetyl-ADP-ribose deacetylase (regulator of RNase III)
MLPTVFLHTYDSALADAWRAAFKSVPGAHVVEEDILSGHADAIVSPANSFGYMDGGIDLAYRNFFGHQLQVRLQERIHEQFFDELVVGHATIILTGHEAFPHLISAPTMRVPERIGDTVNVYPACRAALIAVLEYNRGSAQPIASLRTPGLGTGVGGMTPKRAAFQMRSAFDAVANRRRMDAAHVLVHHDNLRSG